MLLTRKYDVSLTNLANCIVFAGIIFTFIPNCLAWDVASPHERNRQCAQIFFQASLKGPNFVLKDEEQISDLTEIQSYYRKAIAKAKSLKNDDDSDQRYENETILSPSIVYSFHIEEGCKLEVSPLPYLKGNVREFLGDVEEVPEDWFVPKSVACECPKVLLIKRV